VQASSGPRIYLTEFNGADIYVLDPGADEVTLLATLEASGTVVDAVGDYIWVARPHEKLQQFRLPLG
jgi:hypothetical protein